MNKMVTVIFPVTFNLDDMDIKVDMKRIKKGDEKYISQLQEQVKDFAGQLFEISSVDPVIHSSDIDELVE